MDSAEGLTAYDDALLERKKALDPHNRSKAPRPKGHRFQRGNEWEFTSTRQPKKRVDHYKLERKAIKGFLRLKPSITRELLKQIFD